MYFRSILSCALVFCSWTVVHGQRVQPKTAAPPVAYEGWTNSYTDAVRLARKSDRPILLVFSGSDWCKNSQALTREIFRTHEFASWSTRFVVKLEVDFPKHHQLPDSLRRENERLLARFAGETRTFPMLVLIDADGRVLGRWTDLPKSVRHWTMKIEIAIPPKRHADDQET